MMLLFFAAIAPLFSFRWRRLVILGGGGIAEAFSHAPFGAILGLFFLIVILIELLEQRLIIKETAGWLITALGAIGIVALGEAASLVVFDHAPYSLAVALFASKLIIGIIIVGFLWTPIKLSMMK